MQKITNPSSRYWERMQGPWQKVIKRKILPAREGQGMKNVAIIKAAAAAAAVLGLSDALGLVELAFHDDA